MKLINCEKFKVTEEKILQFQLLASSPVLSYYLYWWKGPDRHSLFSWRLKETSPRALGRRTHHEPLLLWASRGTLWKGTPWKRWKNKREGTAWTPPCIFLPTTGQCLQQAEISGMLPGQGCADIFPFPTHTSSSRLLQQEIGPKFPLQALAILTRVQDPPQTKGSAWKNNRLPSWKDLEELLKRKWNPNIISCS